MPRLARVVVEGVPHHITQRGNGRCVVFDNDRDRLLYLSLLRRYSKEYRLTIWAWCLMTNHIHLLAVPERHDSLKRTLRALDADYARYINLQRGTCGHLWQARFYSCVVGTEYLWEAIAYIERNPVRANLVRQAEDYRWSSLASRLSGADRERLLDLEGWKRAFTPERWRDVLRGSLASQAFQERLREATRAGRPLCSDTEMERLERELHRPLRPKPPGRPKKRV